MKLLNLYKNLLLERFVNLFSKQEMQKYIDEIWDILQRSYRPIGGFLTASSKEDLINKAGMIKAVRKDGRLVAVKVYKDSRGRKSIAAGTDGSQEGKEWLKKMFQEDVKFSRAWGEFSGAAEHLMLKYGGVPIPNELAGEILGKKILKLSSDGFHYTREINGEPHEKILIGTPE
jgi:hypothetical protein